MTFVKHHCVEVSWIEVSVIDEGASKHCVYADVRVKGMVWRGRKCGVLVDGRPKLERAFRCADQDVKFLRTFTPIGRRPVIRSLSSYLLDRGRWLAMITEECSLHMSVIFKDLGNKQGALEGSDAAGG